MKCPFLQQTKGEIIKMPKTMSKRIIGLAARLIQKYPKHLLLFLNSNPQINNRVRFVMKGRMLFRCAVWAIMWTLLGPLPLLPPCVNATPMQSTPSDSVYHMTSDTLTISLDPTHIYVLADSPERYSMILANVQVDTAGYYTIFVQTGNDSDQHNESFYLKIRYPDGTFAEVCDANTNGYKVIADRNPPKAAVETYNAGTYFFEAGINTIIIYHYATIALQFPQYWVGPTDSASIHQSPESVHVHGMQVVRARQGFDLVLDYTANADTFLTVEGTTYPAVAIGNLFTCELNIQNAGSDTARSVRLWVTIPDSAFPLQFSISPDSLQNDTLRWQLNDLPPGGNQTIRFALRASDNIPTRPFPLKSMARVRSTCESNPKNNADSILVLVYDPCDLFQPTQPDIRVSPQTVEVGDSVRIEVFLPRGVVWWDLQVQFADGTVDTTFADTFIDSASVQGQTWIPVPPFFTSTFFRTSAEEEQILFRLITMDKCDNYAMATAQIIVRSSNDCLLDLNVFNPNAKNLGILFKLSSNRRAKIDLYDATGYYICTIVEGDFQAGWNRYVWDGRKPDGTHIGSGLYIIVIRSGKFTCWKKIILVR